MYMKCSIKIVTIKQIHCIYEIYCKSNYELKTDYDEKHYFKNILIAII